MASGWGCQFMTISEKGETDWCRKLKKKCNPGTKGCIIYGSEFTQPEFLSFQEDEPRKVKKRVDNPLDGR